MLNLDSEQNRKALIRLSQFVLEEEAEGIRDDLQDKIVEAALFWGTKDDEFTSTEKVPELIEEEIRLITFRGLTLDNILSRLLKKGSIVENEKGAYKVSVLRRTEFRKLVNEKKRRMERINGQFLLFLEREYRKKLNDEQKKECLEKLYSILASLALEKSDLIARIVTQKDLENLPMELGLHKLYGILGKIQELELRNAVLRAIKLIFRNGSGDFCGFIYSLTQNLMCIQILNLDPECRALERKAFSDKILYLDTNVLIGIVCPTSWQYTPAMHLVKLSKSLGVKCSVAKRTCDEFMKILEEANRVFKKWEAPMRFLENADNEFLISFWSEKQTDQTLSWNSYYQRNKDIGKVLSEQGIHLYVESLDNIRENQHFEDIMTQVNMCYLAVKRKSSNVCEHDALLLILVRELRKEQSLTLLGPNSWFITGDDSLLCVDDHINSIPEFTNKTPSSMLCDVWLEMISLFLPLKVRERDALDAFAMLIKHQFALVPFQIDTKKMVKIQGSWMKYEWLKAEDIIRIQNQEWTKQYLKRLSKVKRKGTQAKAEEMGRIFAKKLEAELRAIKDDKLKKLTEEKQALSKKETLLLETIERQTDEIGSQQILIDTQKDDIEQKLYIIQLKDTKLEREAHLKKQLRIVSTIAGLFSIFSPLALICLEILPITLESVAFGAAFLIVGAILIFFGIAPERADVSIKARLGIPKS